MGLRKWLGHRFSALQRAGDCTKADDADEQQLQIQRRHTTGEPGSRSRAVHRESRPNSFHQPEHRFAMAERSEIDSICTLGTAIRSLPHSHKSDSDVSMGIEDELVPPSVLATRAIRSSTSVSITATPECYNSRASNVSRFSWKHVLGQPTKSKRRQSVVTQETENDMAPNTDMALRPEDDGVDVLIQGWLEKCGQHFKTWHWRFFVLRNDGVLSYYSDETGKKLKGSLELGLGSKANVSVQTHAMDKKFVLAILTPQRGLMISAPSHHVMAKWVDQLQAAGAKLTQPWNPLCETVNFNLRDSVCNHEWLRYDDPTSYIHMEGCLLKRGHVAKTWKNRFFRIEQGELRYFTENQSERKGSVPLKDTIVSPGMAQCPDGRKYYFVLTSKDGKFEMHLNAHNEKSMHLWIEALQEAQTALGRMAGNTETVAGLSLVIKRAEEIPLGKIEVIYQHARDIDIVMEKRTEALVVVSSPRKRGVAVGSQLIAVEGHNLLRETFTQAREILRASSFPMQLEFLLPPYKRGVLVKKSRSGFQNWKRRVVVVTNGEMHYYKQVLSYNGDKKAPSELKHRKSFSLAGCYLNLVHVSDRDLCIVVARSPSDKLVLQTSSEEERMEWASVIYCSIRMVTQGITSGHIENLQLEQRPSACL